MSVPEAAIAQAAQLPPFQTVGDTIPASLTAAVGDAQRGRALVIARDAANCLNCHSVPETGARFFGTVGPSLEHVASRLTTPQLRLRIVDITRVKSDAAMPSYYRIVGLDRVAGAYGAKPILDAGQAEDIVAYLSTLR